MIRKMVSLLATIIGGLMCLTVAIGLIILLSAGVLALLQTAPGARGGEIEVPGLVSRQTGTICNTSTWATSPPLATIATSTGRWIWGGHDDCKGRYTFVLDGSDAEQSQLIALLEATPKGYRARVIPARLLDCWHDQSLAKRGHR